MPVVLCVLIANRDFDPPPPTGQRVLVGKVVCVSSAYKDSPSPGHIRIQDFQWFNITLVDGAHRSLDSNGSMKSRIRISFRQPGCIGVLAAQKAYFGEFLTCVGVSRRSRLASVRFWRRLCTPPYDNGKK